MSFCPNCPTQTVSDPPTTVVQNMYHPQIVQVIHPIEFIRRHYCVPVPRHCYTYTVKDEMWLYLRRCTREKKKIKAAIEA